MSTTIRVAFCDENGTLMGEASKLVGSNVLDYDLQTKAPRIGEALIVDNVILANPGNGSPENAAVMAAAIHDLISRNNLPRPVFPLDDFNTVFKKPENALRAWNTITDIMLSKTHN